MFICSRCGEVVTCPYFHGGQVYGYTCIDIIAGKAKKQARVDWIELFNFEVLPQSEYEKLRNRLRFKIYKPNSKKFVVAFAEFIADAGVYQYASDLLYFDKRLFVGKKYAIKNRFNF